MVRSRRFRGAVAVSSLCLWACGGGGTTEAPKGDSGIDSAVETDATMPADAAEDSSPADATVHESGTADGPEDSALQADTGEPPQDAGTDSASEIDSSTGEGDSGVDTGPADSAAPPADSGVADSAPADTAVVDSAPADTAVADSAAPADSAPADSGQPADTGSPDTSPAETGSPDAAEAGTMVVTVSGTVSGLGGGDSFEIAVNGGDHQFLSNNGAFSFSAPLTIGATYAITVVAQPSTPILQSCTVTNGSGTVSSATISGVTIACTSTGFAVGGTVAGLAVGDTVSLSDNGNSVVTVAANGSFTFPAMVAGGQAYSVAVLTQPGTPVQTCTVAGGSGTVSGGAVTSVAVTCAFLAPSVAPAAAYSVRKLFSAYTGNAMQVRRGSDSTLLDIGFTAGGDLDTVGLLAFVGSSSGYVAKWYDQSGNARDQLQGTSGMQPMIATAGVVNMASGKPAVQFDGATSLLSSSQLGAVLYGSQSYFSVFQALGGPNNLNGTEVISAIMASPGWHEGQLIFGTTAPYTPAYYMYNSTNTTGYEVTGPTGVGLGSTVIFETTVNVGGASTVATVYIDGTAGNAVTQNDVLPETNNPNGGGTVRDVLTLGSTSNSLGSYRWPLNGYIGEAILFSSVVSTTDRTGIESSQGTYYGVTVQ